MGKGVEGSQLLVVPQGDGARAIVDFTPKVGIFIVMLAFLLSLLLLLFSSSFVSLIESFSNV